MAGRLDGRRILIVGAGQQTYGIEDPPIGNGRAMAVLFAREGAAVALGDINADSAEETAELVRGESGECTVIAADASTEEGIAAMFAGAREGLGALDGLVMNVGIGAGLGIAGTTVKDWDLVMAVNARSHFLGCKQALTDLEDGGSIVLVGSIAGRETMPLPSYAASKAALEAICRQVAVEAAPRLRANLLLPGLIDTAIGRMATQLNPKRAEVHIPLRRQGTAWEVAEAALFLLSDAASYITGTSLVADGGLSVAPRR